VILLQLYISSTLLSNQYTLDKPDKPPTGSGDILFEGIVTCCVIGPRPHAR